MMKISLLADKLGMCTSFVCALHCLAIPIFLILGVDSALVLIDQEWIELTIIMLSFLIGFVSFLVGYVQHRQHFIPVLFLAGFLLIINGESVASSWLAVILSVAGASIIAYAHFQNLKWKQYAYSN